ncbi:MAG: hypothetical protein ABEJ76_03490 [Halanaeroarchaeum sp.]
MYAASFVGTLRRVDAILDRALALQSYRDEPSALAIADEAISVVDDLGEQASVVLPNADLDGHRRRPGDDAVEAILRDRFEDGFDHRPADTAVDDAREAGRVQVVDDSVLVPISGDQPGIRNWWLLVGLAIDWLDDLADGFARTHGRASLNGSDTVETAYWAVVDRLAALREALSRARTIGRYVVRSLQRGGAGFASAISTIATAITEGSDA